MKTPRHRAGMYWVTRKVRKGDFGIKWSGISLETAWPILAKRWCIPASPHLKERPGLYSDSETLCPRSASIISCLFTGILCDLMDQSLPKPSCSPLKTQSPWQHRAHNVSRPMHYFLRCACRVFRWMGSWTWLKLLTNSHVIKKKVAAACLLSLSLQNYLWLL